MAVVTVCSDFGAQENKICHFFHFFPFYLPWSNGTWCHDLSFLNAEFQVSCFTLLSFTLIKRLFSSSSLSAFKVGSSAYLRLLIFLQATLIPACGLSSGTFQMMFSAYKIPFMYHSLVMAKGLHNSMKLWAMPCGATQNGWVIVKSLRKCGLLEKKMATHSSVLS